MMDEQAFIQYLKKKKKVSSDTLENISKFLDEFKEKETKEQDTPYLQTELEKLNDISTEHSRKKKNPYESPADEKSERYQLIELLGEGGMGIVQRVYDKVLGREVALKKSKLKNENNSLSEKQDILLWRLKREASITSMLEHPNIVPIHDLEKGPKGDVYFTMRKVEGRNLRKVFQDMRKGKEAYSEEKLLFIFLKICDAIAYAHSKGVVHRDLKPSNIMVGDFGEVYVMDWGIAKLLNKNEEERFFKYLGSEPHLLDKNNLLDKGGTSDYMPPEQEEESPLVHFQADIFALGKILQQCFTLFSPIEELQKILLLEELIPEEEQEEIEDIFCSMIPAKITAIVGKATEEEQDKRYQMVHEFVADLNEYQRSKVAVKEKKEKNKFFSRKGKQYKVVFGILIVLLLFITVEYLKSVPKNWSRFNRAYARAKDEMNFALNKQEKQTYEQIKHLLKAFSALNNALLFGYSLAVEKDKLRVGEELIRLSCLEKDYHLADYITMELQEISFLTEQRKKKLLQLVSKNRLQSLTQQEVRLDFWVQTLLQDDLELSVHEQALCEISKMKEDKIFERLFQILKEGKLYFLTNTSPRSSRKDQFYQTMAKALGQLGNPQAAKVALSILKQMSKKYNLQAEKKESTLEYMISLTEALAYLKDPETVLPLLEIRLKMGKGQYFWKKTNFLFRELSRFYWEDESELETEVAYHIRGFVKQHIGDRIGAIKDYSKAVALNSKFAQAYYNRAKANKELMNQKEAFKDFTKAIWLDPQNNQNYVSRGELSEEQKNISAAIQDYCQALEIDFQASLAERLVQLIAQRALQKFMKEEYLEAREDIFLFKKYAPKGHSKESELKTLLLEIEEQLPEKVDHSLRKY